jgi:hypothetical protein
MFKLFCSVFLVLSVFYTYPALAVKKVYLNSQGQFLSYILNPGYFSGTQFPFDPYKNNKSILTLGDHFENMEDIRVIELHYTCDEERHLSKIRSTKPPRSLLRPAGVALKKRSYSEMSSSESESESENHSSSKSEVESDHEAHHHDLQSSYVFLSLAEEVAEIARPEAFIYKTGYACPKELSGQIIGNIRYLRVDHWLDLPFHDNMFDTVVLKRGICYCFLPNFGVPEKTCAGLDFSGSSGRRFILEVARILDKKNPDAFAFLHGYYYISDIGSDFLLPRAPQYQAIVEKEKIALSEIEKISLEVENLFPQLEVSLISDVKPLESSFQWNVKAANQPHVDRKMRRVPAFIGIMIRIKGQNPINLD